MIHEGETREELNGVDKSIKVSGRQLLRSQIMRRSLQRYLKYSHVERRPGKIE